MEVDIEDAERSDENEWSDVDEEDRMPKKRVKTSSKGVAVYAGLRPRAKIND